MSRLVKTSGWGGAPRASVIFVHGLGGHAYDTWRRAPDNDTFWPLWLAKDVQGISVYTLAYEAPPSNWLGTSMPLQDRAVNVLEILLSEPGLRTGPIAFVSHSLGGLIVKQILLDMQQQEKRRPEAKDLLERVTQVVFAATPHTGSRQGTLLDRLRFLAWPSSIARTLVANDPALRSINVAYRGLADERRNVLQHRIFYETQGTPTGVIVDEASSDPGLPGDPPVPVDANHVSIVKPFDRSSILYARTRDFIAKSHPVVETQEGALEIYPLPPIRSEQSPNIVPKLIRIAAIGLVALIGYKGVQALIAPATNGPSKEQIEQIQKPQGEQLAVKDSQIAALNAQNAAKDDLIKMLVENNPGVRPGSREAVTGAVGSIGQDAAEGDARSQQVLDLLKENKIAEATQLLKTVAEDETTRAEQETASAEKKRKKAATAWRNLGAIANLRDPKAAREAYEKALALDPDDAESLAFSGIIEIDYGDLNKAQSLLERVLKLTESRDQAFYNVQVRTPGEFGGLGIEFTQEDGLIKVVSSMEGTPASRAGILSGDIIAGIDGDSVQGLSLDQVSDKIRGAPDTTVTLRILRGANKDPRDVKLIRASIQDNKLRVWRYWALIGLGKITQQRGDLAGALKFYKDGLAFADRLATSNPGSVVWEIGLASSYGNIGEVQQAQSDLAGALKSYEDSRAIIERLAQSDSSNAYLQGGLAASYGRIGGVQQAQGNLKGALKSYTDDLAIMDRLAKSDPGNSGWQRELSVSYNKIGNVQKAQGNLAGALKSYQDGLAIAERLATSDPGNAEWQRDLSLSYNNVGDVQEAQGNLAGALKSYQDGLAIAERLATSDPGNAEWQRDLSLSYNNVGDVQEAQGNLAGALKFYQDGLAIAERLATSDPGNAEWQRDLSVSFTKLASAYLASGDKAKALDFLRQGRAIMARLTKLSPDNAEWKNDLAEFDLQIAELAPLRLEHGRSPRTPHSRR